jgi:uncharacterized membrane-anchored protein YitT (DUF2179 family)
MAQKKRLLSRFKRIKFSRDYLLIPIGAAIMALGIGVFLADAKVVPGGVSGLALAVHYLTGDKIPVGPLMWVMNIPLFIWGVLELGRQFGARTFVGFTSLSLFISLFRGEIPGLSLFQLNKLPSLLSLREDDFLFLILIGAVLTGLGLGIIFKYRGSTAGSDIMAAVARKRWGIKPGTAFIVVDFFVISFAGLAIHFRSLADAKPALVLTLYALFLLFISSKVIDIILDGFDYARSAFIISKKSNEISDVIMNDLSRGATVLEGRGLYLKQKREILYTVLTRKEIGAAVQMVKKIDPEAFMIINNVHEVLGSGFRPRL